MNINGDLMTLKLEAASPRLAVSGAGRIALTDDDGRRAVVQRRRHVARSVHPRVQSAAVAVHDGDRQRQRPRRRSAREHRRAARRGHGRSARSAAVRLPAAQRDADPPRARSPHGAHHRDAAGRRRDPARYRRARSTCTTSGSRCAPPATPASASCRGSCRTSAAPAARRCRRTFEGPMRDPIVSGTMNVDNGRIRHFDLPHALENISGPLRFDTRSIRLDEVTARLGGGPVQVRRPHRHRGVPPDPRRRLDVGRGHAPAVPRGDAVARRRRPDACRVRSTR